MAIPSGGKLTLGTTNYMNQCRGNAQAAYNLINAIENDRKTGVASLNNGVADTTLQNLTGAASIEDAQGFFSELDSVNGALQSALAAVDQYLAKIR